MFLVHGCIKDFGNFMFKNPALASIGLKGLPYEID
jgi:hypothetical protein